jgi:hypothetical protein
MFTLRPRRVVPVRFATTVGQIWGACLFGIGHYSATDQIIAGPPKKTDPPSGFGGTAPAMRIGGRFCPTERTIYLIRTVIDLVFRDGSDPMEHTGDGYLELSH